MNPIEKQLPEIWNLMKDYYDFQNETDRAKIISLLLEDVGFVTYEGCKKVAESLKTYTFAELPLGVQTEMINTDLRWSYPHIKQIERPDVQELV